MTEEQLIKLFLEKVEDVLYLDQSYNDKNIAEIIVRILESVYDI